MTTASFNALAVVGPTASGKSDFALDVARYLRDVKGERPEIICCDSVQVYRGFDIGSAKPGPQDLAEFPHHLVDVVSWSDEFDAGVYATLAVAAVTAIRERGGIPVFVGGTGLYLRAYFGQGFDAALPKSEALRRELDAMPTADLLRELIAMDPVRAGQIHANDRVRILRAVEICRLTGGPVAAGMVAPGGAGQVQTERRAGACVIFLHPDRAWLHQRIAARAASMVSGGLIEEVAGLLNSGCPATAKPMQAIGYRETASHIGALAGDRLDRINRCRLAQDITVATRQYAKRQITWFKGAGADLVGTSRDLNIGSVVERLSL